MKRTTGKAAKVGVSKDPYLKFEHRDYSEFGRAAESALQLRASLSKVSSRLEFNDLSTLCR